MAFAATGLLGRVFRRSLLAETCTLYPIIVFYHAIIALHCFNLVAILVKRALSGSRHPRVFWPRGAHASLASPNC
jgi:hypothetical protein